jgi:hypothetical protein
VPDFDINSESGEQFSFGGQITKPAAPGLPPPWPNYPTNAAGYTLRFTAKRRKEDTTPLVQKDSVANSTDVTLASGGAWSVRILSADTTAFVRTEEMAYDVALLEPDGTKTIVSKGTWMVEKSVGL